MNTVRTRGNISWARAVAIGAIFTLLPVPAAVAARDQSSGKQKHRVSHHLDRKIHSAGAGESIPVIIQTVAEPSPGHFARLHRRGGAVKGRHHAFHGYSARMPASQIKALSEDPEVTRISFDAPVQAALDVAVDAVRAGSAMVELSGLDGSGIGIAVIDTGVQLHNDLARLKKGDRIVEIEVVGHEKGLADYYGHGTAVAGVINGNGFSSSGPDAFRTFKGLAPGSRIISVRALAPDGSGQTSDIIMAIEWVIRNAARRNIRVLNLSLGHPVYESYTTDPLCLAARSAVEAGIVVVTAAGNGGLVGSGFGTINSPANDPSVITVGAMDDGDTVARDDDIPAAFSAKGPTLIDHVVKPDLMAPGTFIVSLRAPNSYIDTAHPEFMLKAGDYMTGDAYSWMDGSYTVLSGTSLAAPMVSAAAALMLENDPTLTPATVKARLMASAMKDESMVFETGAGLLDVAAALEATGYAASALSPTVVVLPDGTVSIEDTADSWGGEWQQGLIWGFRRSIATLALTENDQVTASGLLWGGSGARFSYSLSVVEASGLVWGTGSYTRRY
jgi:serine protease AprX